MAKSTYQVEDKDHSTMWPTTGDEFLRGQYDKLVEQSGR
jgi:hypothetical protein